MNLLEEIDRRELAFIFNSLIKENINSSNILKVKKLYSKGYSIRTINTTKWIINHKLYFLLRFFCNDSFNYQDESTGISYSIDRIILYYVKTKDYKIYLLHSIVYDKTCLQIKTENVEIYLKIPLSS